MPYRLLVNAASRAGGRLGWARAALGALLGIVLAATTNHVIGAIGNAALPWLIAPLGASAVLVFAVPASPLAQPWPVFGGSVISALIGLTAAHSIPFPEFACAVAVGGAIGAMSLLRCLHPPGGACALLAAMSGPQAFATGPSGLLLPLASNLVALMIAGWFYNGLTGHAWPHRAAQTPAMPPAPRASGYAAADLDAVLEEWDEVLDVSRDDLDALFRALEKRGHDRWHKQEKARERAARLRRRQASPLSFIRRGKDR